ncbi:NADPH dehydrogenase [Hypoxylon sp. FL1284]|nr:NADPH dehydrogenase [Hypoxylon sp. FL1284]
MSPVVNKGAPNAAFYTPVQDPPVGTALDPSTAPTLFQPLKIRGMELQNRFVVSPMCADDGHLTDWHFAHLSQFILRGSALTMVEATAVLPNGRITPQCPGMWKDSQIGPLKRIADFAHSQGQKLGVQLAHAGRKASTVAPWLRSPDTQVAPPEDGGWADDVWAPSAVRFDDGYPDPKAMTADDIRALVQAFADAARRAVAAGVDTIEIHGAHGYLVNNFLSPLSNRRADAYGGSFENRTRVLFDIIGAVRAAIPASMPLLLRISATEWVKEGDSWDLEQSVRLARLLPAAGVDLLDVSSAGNAPLRDLKLSLPLPPYYQVDLAGHIRDAVRADGGAPRLLVGAVGLITNAEMARSIVQEGRPAPARADGRDTVEVADEDSGRVSQADLVFMARQYLREPEFPLRVAHQLGVDVKWPNQYSRAAWPKDQKL